MQQIYKFKNIVAILYLFSSCTAHDMLGTNRSCMKSCTWPPNCVQRRVQWAVQWFTEVQRTSRGQDHMMRGGRVREMLAVIEGHKSGAKIKIFAHVHPTSQGSLLSWQNKASHSRSWMTLNISSCCFITLTSCCWESVLEHDTRQRGWQEARLRSAEYRQSRLGASTECTLYRPTVTRIRTLLSRLSLKWPPPRYKTMKCSLHLSDSDKPPSCGHVVCSNYPAWACSLYSESRAE